MKLTAKQLIEELQKIPPETEIWFTMADGCCSDFLELDINFADFEVSKLYGKDHVDARIHFDAVPGYRSCIEAGGTKRLAEEKDKRLGRKDEG